MSRAREVGDNISYHLDSDESLDAGGYCLTTGDDDGDTVKKTDSASATFLGTNQKSSAEVVGMRREELNTGGGPRPYADEDGQGGMAVEQDGVVMMRCETGNDYAMGDAVYLSSTNGVANNSDSGSNTQVGVVSRSVDHSDTSGDVALVAVNITGYVGN